MARKSKYSTAESNSGIKMWKAALYIRLSREDGDKIESDSVVNQRSLLTSYVDEQDDVCINDYYIDDGWSGTNFERPEFIRMMADVRSGLVNCVIVKDLSRFGRNYIEAGNYIEQIFPFLGIRFIAVNDNLDSFKNPNEMNTIMVPFKNLINDEYCRNVSNNVRKTLNNKRKEGKFVGSFASYGYLKDPQDKNKLIVDEEVAPIIRDIYDWFIEGYGVISIAKKLNDLGIPSPAEYKRQQGLNYRNPSSEIAGPKLWGYSSVKRILKHRVYCGDVIQGIMKTTSYKVKKLQRMPEEEWFVKENAHEAIISREKYQRVQEIFASDTRVSPGKGQLTLLAGFMKCADCGRAMNRHRNIHSYGDYHYYVCSTYKKVSKAICTRHSIRSDYVEQALLEAIQKQVQIAVNVDEVIGELKKSKNTIKTNEDKYQKIIDKKKTEIEKYIVLQEGLYDDWKTNVLTKEEYIRYKQRYKEKIEKLNKDIEKMEEEKRKYAELIELKHNDFVDSFIKYRNVESLSREMLLELVDKILVHEDKSITICFKFRNELEQCREILELNGETLKVANE